MYPQYSIDRINDKIQELEKLKQTYQNPQPMNVFNVGNTPQIDFEARFLKKNETPEEILVQRKTAFISLENKELAIKETNGDINKYEIVLPKDEKDLKIEELEERIKKYEYELSAIIESSKSNEKNGKSTKFNDTKSEKDTG